MKGLYLSQVTLIAVTPINLDATLRAINACWRNVTFAACKLLPHRQPAWTLPGLDVTITPKIGSADQYSRFILTELVNHVETSRCVVIQWDGYILGTDRWNPQFLDYDYIGASSSYFTDGHDVGNRGFSLRSRRLPAACQFPKFVLSRPENVAIGRHNKPLLEAEGLRFAPCELTDKFSTGRTSSLDTTFEFYSVWHMPKVIGANRFWDMYCGLEDQSSTYHKQSKIMRQLEKQPHGLRRSWKIDEIVDPFHHPNLSRAAERFAVAI
jgi:hypothetical protein